MVFMSVTVYIVAMDIMVIATAMAVIIVMAVVTTVAAVTIRRVFTVAIGVDTAASRLAVDNLNKLSQ